MILLSWICTILVLTGFVLNATGRTFKALIIWIVGDIGWIIFDASISNLSHATLSTIIILINLYGILNARKDRKSSREIC
jgi:hypothetical protein